MRDELQAAELRHRELVADMASHRVAQRIHHGRDHF
jgi:hypothetical protein